MSTRNHSVSISEWLYQWVRCFLGIFLWQPQHTNSSSHCCLFWMSWVDVKAMTTIDETMSLVTTLRAGVCLLSPVQWVCQWVTVTSHVFWQLIGHTPVLSWQQCLTVYGMQLHLKGLIHRQLVKSKLLFILLVSSADTVSQVRDKSRRFSESRHPLPVCIASLFRSGFGLLKLISDYRWQTSFT